MRLICAPLADVSRPVFRARFSDQEGILPDRAFQIDTYATPETVRAILADLRALFITIGLLEDQCGIVEIAVAEALNNIVEHAYAPVCAGPLRLRVWRNTDRLCIELRDNGAPMPGLLLPDAHLPDATGPLETLPEGGFGWFLIHDLSDSLHYSRIGTENQLTLEFALNPETGG